MQEKFHDICKIFWEKIIFTIKFKKKKMKKEEMYLLLLGHGIESFSHIHLVHRLKHFHLTSPKIGKNNWNLLFWKRMYVFDNKF